MAIIQQGETLQFVGRLMRRVKGTTNYEVVDDLLPYGIEIYLIKAYDEAIVSRFKIYKESCAFYTDAITSANLAATNYAVKVAVVVDSNINIANNQVALTIKNNTFGVEVSSNVILPDYGSPSPTEGSIESGEWEYQIELARSGSSAAINQWSNPADVIIFALGSLLKGKDGDPYTLTDADKEAIAKQAAAEVDIPTNTSDLTNDSDFTTLTKVLEQVYGKSETLTATEVKALIAIVQGELDTLVGGDASTAIDSYNEIVAFLSSFTDSEDLASVLLALKNEIVALMPAMETVSNIADFNDYTSVGYYGVVTQVSGTLNAPEEGYHNWALEVILKSARVVMQRATRLGDNDQLITYMREVNHVDSLYTTWQRVVDAQYMAANVISEAPQDGKAYVRNNGAWVEAGYTGADGSYIPQLFVDLWNNAASYSGTSSSESDFGSYNIETGYFELNGIVDIGYEEARRIYNQKVSGVVSQPFFMVRRVRTNLPFQSCYTQAGSNLARIFQASNQLEIACIYDATKSNMGGYGSVMFYSCANLHTVVGVFRITSWSSSYTYLPFLLCPSLENVNMYKDTTVSMNMVFTGSPLISTASILYFIQNSQFNSAGETLTLHADSWERISTDPDIIAALEAQPLLTLASA